MGDWHHAPIHRMQQAGAYIVTAGTYEKAHHFRSARRLTMLEESLKTALAKYEWSLQAWAIFSNHYHLIATSPRGSGMSLEDVVSEVHKGTSEEVNREDSAPGRKVWFQYWETLLTFERSYFARLQYVNQNPVKHRIVRAAHLYPWCSASWMATKASRSFMKMLGTFKTDRLNIEDPFEPSVPEE